MTKANGITLSGVALTFSIGVIFWSGYIYGQVQENTKKLKAQEEEIEEVSEVSSDVLEIQVEQRHIRSDVQEIKELVKRIAKQRGN